MVHENPDLRDPRRLALRRHGADNCVPGEGFGFPDRSYGGIAATLSRWNLGAVRVGTRRHRISRRHLFPLPSGCKAYPREREDACGQDDREPGIDAGRQTDVALIIS